MKQPKPYNPLDRLNLARSVADTLLRRPLCELPIDEAYEGAGIYAIYYTGSFEAYVPIASANEDGDYHMPIYVGKAVPEGARKGLFGLSKTPGRALFKRLGEHAKSIEQAANLELADFRTRHLVVDDIWIPLGESLLLHELRPVWNVVVDGFGNHAPGKGRLRQQCSQWDALHPGREWARSLPPCSKSVEDIQESIAGHLSSDERKASSLPCSLDD